MSDQGKWAKIWISTLANPDLENLELHEWARWVRLIVFMKAHGTNGKLVFDPPFRALQHVLRVESWDALREVIRHCPGFTLFEPSQSASHQPSQHKDERYMIVCKNWYKFQGDMSNERMRKLREKRTVTPIVTSDGKSDSLRREEKRRITSTSTSPAEMSTSRSRLGPLAGPVATRETADPEKAEIAEANKAWEVKPKGEIKTYEEAGEDELCGPPKDLWKKVMKAKPGPDTD